MVGGGDVEFGGAVVVSGLGKRDVGEELRRESRWERASSFMPGVGWRARARNPKPEPEPA